MHVVVVDPRLFHCSNAKGKFRVEEVHSFSQEDLSDEDVFLLDAHDSLYVWVGSKANKDEILEAAEFAERYVKEADDGREDGCPVTRVSAGFEPVLFTQHFIGWNPMVRESC